MQIRNTICDSCGNNIVNGLAIHYTDATFNFCEKDLLYKSPEEKASSTPIIDGKLQISDTKCNKELDIMPHKFKCHKLENHLQEYHIANRLDWDGVDVTISWRYTN